MKDIFKKNKVNLFVFATFAVFVLGSYAYQFDPGVQMSRNFNKFAIQMASLLPPAFILIGLFNVWVKRETVEQNFGEASGIKKYIWSVLLAATTVGGTFVAFPVAHALYTKGAKYSSIMAYVTSASLVMIPMSIMEASILGPKFTMIRIGVSIPLVIVSSILLGKYLESIKYVLPNKQM